MTRNGAYVPALGYDRLTALYDPVVRVTTREATFKRRLLAQAGVAAGERVLDLACGTGTLAVRVKREEPTAEVTGVDGDPAVLRRAKAKAAEAGLAIAFDEGRADALPYRDDSFDKVLSTLFFHHLDRPTKERTAREIARVLRPGGELHLADWGRPAGPLARALFLPVRLLDGLDNTRDNVEGRLPELLAAAGLEQAWERGSLGTPLGTMRFVSARAPR
jgi:ubiquinone/menaquinone biosynthesis C-methylase UbiE